MKLNFWQWLGLIILVAAGGYWVYDNVVDTNDRRPIAPAAPPATQPA
jgi:hypothetical protein